MVCPTDGWSVYEIWRRESDGSTSFQDIRCAEDSEAQAPPPAPVVTPGMVLEAFRRIPLPASVLAVEGTVTVQGRPEPLRALEAQPNLVTG
jgi:hypothetical protein